MGTAPSDGVDDLIVRAHHAAVCVQDFDAARAFYVQVLGFRVEGEMDRRAEPALGEVVGLPGAVVRWGMLVRDDFRLELFKYYTPQGRTEANRQCDAGYTHLAFEVRDVDAAYARLIAAGHRTMSPPQNGFCQTSPIGRHSVVPASVTTGMPSDSLPALWCTG